jgi:LuxR family maltose regulon positive regulatory protein
MADSSAVFSAIDPDEAQDSVAQHDPLLTTKLHVPRIRPSLVPRPRLTGLLEAGVWRKLTLICAPAGYGKTTLVSEWAQRAGRSLAWLSLDESDNDLGRFLSYFIAALQRTEIDVGGDIQAVLEAQRPARFEPLLTALVNEIAACLESKLEGIPRVLVLDDYHVIGAVQVHEALGFLVENLPPQMHLIVISRADPPLLLSRL